jgi:hypothetical protein
MSFVNHLGAPVFSEEFDVSELADWVELTVAVSDHPFLVGTLQTTLAREGSRGDPAAIAEQVWSELVRRGELCRDSWPLRLVGNRLRRLRLHPNSLLHYYLTSLSLGDDVRSGGRRLFEECVTDLVAGLSGGYALRTGWPRTRGMPASLDEAVASYTALSKEQKIQQQPLPASDKDFGLDVVTWRRFQDGRGGYLPFIGQCATGKNWYETDKHKELQIGSWTPHVTWAVDPVRFFAVPFVIPPDRWFRTSRDAGLVLDRPRLLELALNSPISRRRAASMYAYCRTLYENAA